MKRPMTSYPYPLDRVIKSFRDIKKLYAKDTMEWAYYDTIERYLLLEHKHKDIVAECGKPIYHYFMYSLPMGGRDYFEFLYNPNNPVRFSVETFDSIEEIRTELGRDKK